jgi:CrcB protein
MHISTLLLVFAGGAVGSVLRWWIGAALGHRFQGQFPLATFLINVSGSFLIGALSTLFSVEWHHRHESDLAALILTGFLGGYTTFSSYQMEAVTLYKEQAYRIVSLYWLGSVIAGLAAAALGAWAVRLMA